MARFYQVILIVFFLLSMFLACGCLTRMLSTAGTLNVTSAPRGADVYLDNQYKGRTPLVITDVSPGSHFVELRLSGFESWTTTGSMEERGASAIQATLEPAATPTPVQAFVYTTTVTQSPAPVPATTPDASGTLELLDSSSYISNGDTLNIVGEVKNAGATNLRSVRVVVSFFDATDKVLLTDSSQGTIDILEPGQKSPFHIEETGYAGGYSTFRLTVDKQATTDEAYDGLTIRSPAVDKSDGYHVIGEVKNSGSRKLNSVEVLGTFYDSSGHVIDTAWVAYSSTSAQIPGGITRFTLVSRYPQPSAIASYKLDVQGE
jgi:hypothetical protein